MASSFHDVNRRNSASGGKPKKLWRRASSRSPAVPLQIQKDGRGAPPTRTARRRKSVQTPRHTRWRGTVAVNGFPH